MPIKTAVRRSRPIAKVAGNDDDRTAKKVADAVERIMDRLADVPESIAQQIITGGPSAVFSHLDILGMSEEMTAALRTPLAGVYLAKAFNSLTDVGSIDASLSFNAIEPRAVQFATVQAGKRVVQITRDIQENIASIVAMATQGDLTTKQVASRVRAFIPMLPRHATAAQNLYTRERDRLVKAGKTPADASALAEATFDKAAARYKRIRADMIARTEVLTASNTGRFEGWAAAIQAGDYSQDAKKEWVAGTKACDVCDPSTGEVVRWDEPFENGAMMPPLHPNCRCTAVLLPPEIALRGPTAPTAPNRRGEQMAEGKTPSSRSVHKNPASNPDAAATGPKMTNAEGERTAERIIADATGQQPPVHKPGDPNTPTEEQS